jgi:hypothetical protein
MKKTAVLMLALAFTLIGSFACKKGPAPAPLETRDEVFALFQNPPSEYRTAPLWVWNDRITETQIDEQLADFKARGIGGVFVHPRPGLITPYLSEEWLGLFKRAVQTGKSLGMKIWIYDENSYPSGFAGGHVPAAMPDSVRSGLRMTKAAELPAAFDPEPVAVLRKTEAGFEDITTRLKSETFGAGEYSVFDINRQKPSPWHGGFTYVDIMRREVTEKFLDVTLNAYKQAFGEEFGGVVPGTFQDEAEISPAGGQGMVVVNWTPALFDAFRKKWGYDLRPNLPSLYEDTGDWKRVRHNYYATLLDLFIDNWAKPYYEYCEQNNLVFTGHYWEHEWPRPVVNPDSLAFAAYAHMPGVDILMNDFQRDTHAQFGNARAVKEIRSAANQLGRRRTLSETFGAGGWDMTFFDQKRIADWEYALGVNFVNQHLSYVTIMGARKRDHPLSFSYHEPWWPLYNVLADYFGRLSVVTSLGKQDNRILVLEPTTSAWMHYAPPRESDKIKAIGAEFQSFVQALEAAQADYDLGSENTLRDFGSVEGKTLVVGRMAYDLVVLPPAFENIDAPSLKLLGKYLGRGGKLAVCGESPAFVDGRPSDEPKKLFAENEGGVVAVETANALAKIRELSPPKLGFKIEGYAEGEGNLLFHHRRKLADAELLFLANTDPQKPTRGSFLTSAKSVEEWDAFNGQVRPYPVGARGDGSEVAFDLPPGGSLLLCLKPAEGGCAIEDVAEWTEIPAPPSKVARLEGNVLTLDYCDLTIAGKTERELYFYDAQLRTFKAHGLDRNPWDSAVQYKTNIIDLDKFPADSGFEASFHFDVGAGFARLPFALAVERPHLFKVFINGKEIPPAAGEWWLDKAFGLYRGGPWKAGRNTVTLKASPFTIHSELEPIYLVGDFALKSANPGFLVAPPAEMKVGSWAAQGLLLYGRTVGYTKTLELSAEGTEGRRYVVELGQWLGAAAEVRVNGNPAGVIAFAPFRLDITDALAAGKNEIAVVVFGTLKNTLGPFHNDPRLGSAWPGSFQRGAKGGRPEGRAYSVVDYGLFEDFKIKVR